MTTTAATPTLVLAADERYAMPLAVTLRSVAATAPAGSRVAAKVVHDAIPAPVRARVTGPLSGTAVEVEWVDAATAPFAGLPTSDRFSRAIYFRLTLPDLFPGEGGRALYLDADTLVVDPLDALGERDLGGAAVGAVRDAIFPFVALAPGLPRWADLGVAPDAPYLNTGVLLVDLDAWRDADVTKAALDFLARHGDRMHYFDQDALNGALAGAWHELEPRWNQQPNVLGPTGVAHLGHPARAIAEAREHPAVIHFATADKPWDAVCRHPERTRWLATLDQTDWAGWRPGTRERLTEYRQRSRKALRTLVRG